MIASLAHIQPAGVSSPCVQDTTVFAYQSYLDSTLAQKAILAQPQGGLIISPQAKQIGGFWIALAPWSETPIALRLDKGSASSVFILKPGQVVMPTGGKSRFGSFTYGLPFGWLGGGLATIIVGQTPEADVAWSGNPEVMFHQFRYTVVAAGSVPATVTKDWPTRFPWVNAVHGTNSVAQKGNPILSVVPSRIVLRVRSAALGAGAVLRLLARGFNAFDVDSTGSTIATADKSYFDVSVPADASGISSYPVIALDRTNPIVALGGADAGGIDLIDGAGATSLATVDVDVQRWGTL